MSTNSTFRRVNWLTLILIVLSLVFGSYVATQTAPKAKAATVSGQWSIVPANAPANTTLSAVAAVSSNDVWASGVTYSSGVQMILMEHWDGTAWHTSTPFPKSQTNDEPMPDAFAVISSSDIWMAGGQQYSSREAFIAHWDGTAWQQLQTPDTGGDLPRIPSLDVISSTNIWAFGSTNGDNSSLIEHWDGASWSIIQEPQSLQDNGVGFLFGSCKTSDGNMWIDSIGSGGNTWFIKTDGVTWTVYGPNMPWGNAACSAQNDVWILNVGSYSTSPISRYAGNSWESIASDQIMGGYRGIDSISSNDVWVVGEYENSPQALTKHWDGAQLNTVASPTLAGDSNALYAISAVNTNDVWAVGSTTDSQNVNAALIEHYVSTPAPTVTNVSFNGTEGVTGTGTVNAQSSSNTALTLSATGLPSFASFKDNGNGTGTVTYNPKGGNAGTYTFSVTANDGSQTGTGTITLVIAKATVAHTKMFVYLEGLASSLSQTDASKGNLPTDSFGQNSGQTIGIGIFLNNQFKGSKHTMFSYAGSTISGQPKSYECKNVFDNTTLYNVGTLKIQLRELMQTTPNLDVYLIGHSYGGVLIAALLADMKYNGMVSVNGGSIKGVVTLDSPLGGVPGGPGGFYYSQTVAHYENAKVTPQCKDLNHEKDLESLKELTTIFATGKIPYGSNGHFASLMQEGTVTNQAVAQWAASNKIAVANIGNTRDWSYLPKQCVPNFPTPDSKFQSTQWVTDKSSQMPLYGRVFSSGSTTCKSIDNIGENHNLAMTDSSVAQAVQQLITAGKITNLAVPSLSLQ